jgi:hypothetical protein
MADRLDLDAIAADDELLDLLAAGGESALEAGAHDPALQLLADLRIAVEVEDELPVETIDDPESFLARCAALNPVTDPLARKMAARGLALGVAAVAALSISGVAAAVTGNPLSPYEKVVEKVVDGLRPQTSFPKEQLDGAPLVPKARVVKAPKDYREKDLKQQADLDRRLHFNLDDPPQDRTLDPRPPLARPAAKPVTTPPKPMVVLPVSPKPTDNKSTDEKPTDDKPTGQPTPTPQPSDTPEPTPTDTTTTPPPIDPTPPATDTNTGPTGTPTDSTAASDDANSGKTGQEQQAASEPVSPQGDQAESQPGSDQTTALEDSPTVVTTPTGNPTHPGDDDKPTVNPTHPGDDDKPAGNPTHPGDDNRPTGNPAAPGDDNGPTGDRSGTTDQQTKPTEPTSARQSRTEQPRAESSEKAAHKSSAKHSNGKHSNGEHRLGRANAKYATGKHSSGQYAEGKHAALSRAHGSMAPKTLRQILTVVDGVMKPVRTD